MTKRPARATDERVASLGVLGPIEAWDIHGRPVRVTRGQARVLAVLVEAANEVVPADTLQEKLWPDEAPEDSAAILHTNIWTLRNLFGRENAVSLTPTISSRGSGYQLRIDVLQLDWFRYQRLVAAAARAASLERHAEARLYLADARRLWRGEALLGVTDDFCRPFIRHLEEARADATLRHIDAALAVGEHDALIPQLRHLTGKDPLNESLTRRLMLALYRSGRQAEALAAYDSCRRSLAENGLVPSALLSGTEVAILTHADWTRAPTPSPTAARSGSSMFGTMLVARWPPQSPPAWALGDAELTLIAEDLGGELVEAGTANLLARFDEVNNALEAATLIQRRLKARKGPLGRFLVHDGSHAATRGTRLSAMCDQLLTEARTGQILLFRSSDDPDTRKPPSGSELKDLGQHHVQGSDAVRMYQLLTPEVSDTGQPFLLLPSVPGHNLPSPPHQIIGRDWLVEEVAAHLSRRRIVTLSGPVGVGKTRLGIEVARTLMGQFRDGAWLIELEWIQDPEHLAATIADVLAIDRARGLPAADVLVRELSSRQVLLLLDTCEHLREPVRDLVDRLLAGCPQLTVLVTSLQPLGSDHEEVVLVPPLSIAAGGASPAALLFVSALGAAPTPGDIREVARICELVDGIPLSIELAAARAKQLGVAHLASELEDRLGSGRALALLDAGGKLRRTLDWSFQLLAPQDQVLLVQLAFFVGAFRLEDARAFCGPAVSDLVAALCRLVDSSAVVVHVDSDGVTRYRLLQPVRAFGAAKLAERPDESHAFAERHAEIHLAMAEEADRAFGGPHERWHLDRLDENIGNLRAALSWAIAARRADIAVGLGAFLWRYWFARGHLAEGLRTLRDALALETHPSPLGIRALGGSSYLAWWSGDLEYTRKSAEETAANATSIGDDWGKAWAPLGALAADMFSPSAPVPGLEHRASIEWFVRAGHTWEAGQTLQLLAGIDWHRGDVASAEIGFARALELHRAAGGQAFTDALQAHGLMLAILGRVDEGIREIQTGLELADRRGDRVGICHAFAYRAAIARAEDDFEESARMYSLALRAAYDTGDAWIVLWALDGLAVWAATTRPDEAARLLGRVEAMGAVTGIRLAPRERADHEAAVNLTQARMGKGAARAFNQGRSMTTEEAVELALGLDA